MGSSGPSEIFREARPLGVWYPTVAESWEFNLLLREAEPTDFRCVPGFETRGSVRAHPSFLVLRQRWHGGVPWWTHFTLARLLKGVRIDVDHELW